MSLLSGIANAIFGVSDNGYGKSADAAMQMGIDTAKGAIAVPNPDASALAREHMMAVNDINSKAALHQWDPRTVQVLHEMAADHYHGRIEQATGITRQQLAAMYQNQSGLYANQSAQALQANSAATSNIIDLGTNIAAGNVFPGLYKSPTLTQSGRYTINSLQPGSIFQRAGGPVPLGGWGAPGNPQSPGNWNSPIVPLW